MRYLIWVARLCRIGRRENKIGADAAEYTDLIYVFPGLLRAARPSRAQGGGLGKMFDVTLKKPVVSVVSGGGGRGKLQR